jgi:hypothetical protein
VPRPPPRPSLPPRVVDAAVVAVVAVLNVGYLFSAVYIHAAAAAAGPSSALATGASTRSSG